MRKNLKTTAETKASVLGLNDLVVECCPENNPQTKFEQHEKVLEISLSRAHRLYNNKIWPNSDVVKRTTIESHDSK